MPTRRMLRYAHAPRFHEKKSKKKSKKKLPKKKYMPKLLRHACRLRKFGGSRPAGLGGDSECTNSSKRLSKIIT
jgi:hypothetical protein